MTYASEVLADSPLAFLRLGDASGLTAVDSSGNARNGAYNGTVTLGATGIPGAGGNTALQLAGAGYASIAAAAWQAGAHASAEVWFKTTSTGANSLAARYGTAAGPTGTQYLAIDLQTLNVIRTYAYINGAVRTASATVTGLRDGNWHQAVSTYDGTTLRLYVDGSQVATFTVTGSLPSGNPGWRIGSRLATPTSEITGTLDEFSVYDHALSAARVLVHYNAGNPTPIDIDGQTADEIEQGNAGTILVDVDIDGQTANEIEQGNAGSLTIGVNINGQTANEIEQGNAGTILADTDITGQTANEVEQGNAGSIATGDVVVGQTAHEIEQGNPGIVTQASGTANEHTNQRVRGGSGVPLWTPDVVVPLTSGIYVNDIVVAKWDGYGITNTQLNLTDRVEVRKAATRFRVVVAGRDLTYWRGVATPEPTFELLEPLRYGPGSLTLPQVQVPFEQPGQGVLTWMKPGAPVLVQRVNDSNAVTHTVWVGKLLSPQISANTLVWGMMGQATGPAALQDKQIPLFRRRNDLGFWWWDAIKDLRLPFTPHLGPNTGIVLWNSGGSSLLDHMMDLSARGWTRTGTQFTCKPDNYELGGRYRVLRKDRTTKDFSAYLDDNLCVPDLTRDPAEEPNRMFVSAVSPEGKRIRFAVYPVLSESTAPAFPGTINPGDTGDAVTGLIWRLVVTGYLSLEERPGGYDDDVEDAVKDIQRDAGITVTGIVNNATWNALYDVGITGYDTAGSRILPAEQWDKVRRYNRTPIGNIIGENNNWDPDELVVDRTVEMGPNVKRQQALRWARRNITDEANPNNWTGTITFNGGGLIEGEHNFGDPLTEADIVDAHTIKPGDNIWLPTWDDGTLVHVVAITHGDVVSVTVDTRARDAMQVWEVMARNQESRMSPARAFLQTLNPSRRSKDSIIEFDENGGVIEQNLTKMHQGWNHFPVVAGQAGTIAQLRIWTGAMASDPTEFVVAVTAKEVTDEKWQGIIGNPLTEAGTAKWENQAVRDNLDKYILLYVAGNETQPCGYFPGSKEDDDGEPSGDPLTGVWMDEASFGYATFREPILWVSLYCKNATRIRDGRILWPQSESGS